MNVVYQIWNAIVGAWDWLDGNKTQIGLSIGGVVINIVAAENFFNIHPAFLDPIIAFLQQVSAYLTGVGITHKIVKTAISQADKARANGNSPTPPAPPAQPAK